MTDEMIDDVQNDVQVDEPLENEVIDTPAEDSPEGEEGQAAASPEPDKVTFDEKQQEVFNSQIAKKVAATKAAEREAQELRQKLEELQKKVPQETAPEIPPIPDPYDEDYQTKVAARDQAIQNKAIYDAQQRIQSEYALQTERQRQQEAVKSAQEAITGYVDRAEKLGHERDTVIGATQHLMDIGLSKSAQAYIRDEANGPDIALYLYKNPQALAEVTGMNDVMAVAHIASVVKPQAMGAFRKQDKIPKPVDHLSGKGAAEGDGAPPGATFE